MIKGIGCDIISKDRIKKTVEKWGTKFLNRVFTSKELENAISRKQGYYSYLAKRFAAKEAISKALKTGIGSTLSFKECEILNDNMGAPIVHFLKKGMDFKVHISLSDEQEYAQAFVIIEE